MKIYYFKGIEGNFGDDLNLWIWPKLLPGIIKGQCFHDLTQSLQNEKAGSLFLGIGTLLNATVPKLPVKSVFGTGLGYGEIPAIDDRWNFYCVRGPLSAKALGLAPKFAITDPGVLVRVAELPKISKTTNKFSFMPHHKSHRLNKDILKAVCKTTGINYIDPTTNVELVLKGILSSEVIITEAMHGAIVADALRIPWIPVKTSDFILEFKWQDWCNSLGLNYQPITIPYTFRQITPKTRLISQGSNIVKECLNIVVSKNLFFECLKRIMRNVPPTLSSEQNIETATSRLLEKLDNFKTDYAIRRYL